MTTKEILISNVIWYLFISNNIKVYQSDLRRLTMCMLLRDFGWLLDFSNASCDGFPPGKTPGFILTSGSIPDDYLGCACECQDLPAESGEWAGMGEITAGMRWDGEKPTWDGLGKSDGWSLDTEHGEMLGIDGMVWENWTWRTKWELKIKQNNDWSFGDHDGG